MPGIGEGSMTRIVFGCLQPEHSTTGVTALATAAEVIE
jgi:hypothetical protein